MSLYNYRVLFTANLYIEVTEATYQFILLPALMMSLIWFNFIAWFYYYLSCFWFDNFFITKILKYIFFILLQDYFILYCADQYFGSQLYQVLISFFNEFIVLLSLIYYLVVSQLTEKYFLPSFSSYLFLMNDDQLN